MSTEEHKRHDNPYEREPHPSDDIPISVTLTVKQWSQVKDLLEMIGRDVAQEVLFAMANRDPITHDRDFMVAVKGHLEAAQVFLTTLREAAEVHLAMTSALDSDVNDS